MRPVTRCSAATGTPTATGPGAPRTTSCLTSSARTPACSIRWAFAKGACSPNAAFAVVRGDGSATCFVFGGVDGTRELGGAWNEWGADLAVNYQGPRQSTVNIGLAPNQEFFAGRTYHNFRQSVSGSIQASRDVNLEMFVNWGDAIDFTNQRAAKFVTFSPGATVNLGRRIRGELSYARQVFETEDGDRVFAVDIPQARVLYHFNRRTFLRAILQYRDVKRNPGQYVIPVSGEDSGFLSQLLFSYRIDAQTVFLLGYSDNYAGTDRIDLTQTDRTFFAKLSYAFLF